jgi:hypothetical protein
LIDHEFKDHNDPNGLDVVRVEDVSGRPDRVFVHADYAHVHKDDVPEMALALLQHVRFSDSPPWNGETDFEKSMRGAVSALKNAIKAREEEERRASEKAKLEADAASLFEEYRQAGIAAGNKGLKPWEAQDDWYQETWRNVTKKARELG